MEYNPISSINDGTPIEFVISGSGQDYIDLANTQLYVKLNVRKADNTPIIAASKVSPVNLLLHSLFGEVDIKPNDVLITVTNNTHAYRAYLETLLSYCAEAKTTQLAAFLYCKDAANKIDDADLTVDRQNKTKTTRLICDCKLSVRKVKLSPSVFVAHAKALEHGNAKFTMHRIVCKNLHGSKKKLRLDCSQENLFSGQLPTRLVIGCVDNDAFNGSYEKNPFNFIHCNLNQTKVYLNDQQQSIRPLEPDFENNQYINAYMTLFTATGKQFTDEGNQIHRDDYAKGYTLYALDLTPDVGDDDHFNLIKEENVKVDMKFAAALPNTINVIVYAEYENIIEIDRSRNVISDYSN